MLTTLARARTSRIRGSALLLAIAALVVLPPLLCATPHHSSSPRLVRGFEEPPAKRASLTSPAAYGNPVFRPGVLKTIVLILPAETAHAIVRDIAEAIPNLTLDRSFDTRRGPPVERS